MRIMAVDYDLFKNLRSKVSQSSGNEHFLASCKVFTIRK